MRGTVLTLLIVLLLPLAAAQDASLRRPRDLRLSEGNQFLDVSWDAPIDTANLTHYVLAAQTEGARDAVNVTGRFYRYPAINAVEHSFTVTAIYTDGPGPPAGPIQGAARLPNDLQYFEAGLLLTWLAIFGYAFFLARREARVDRKLEQLLAHRGPRLK